MAYIYQTKNNKGEPHAKYRFQYTNQHGIRTVATGTTSYKETKQIAETLEAQHALVRKGLRKPIKSTQSLSIKDKINEYLQFGHSQGGRGGKPWSKRHAEMRITHLKWWYSQIKAKYLNQLTEILPSVENKLRKLYNEERSGKTINNYAESLKSFFNYCVDRKYLEENPLQKLKKFDSTPISKRRCFTQDEITKILEVAEYPFKILYTVAYCSGLRAGELRSLTTFDLNVQNLGLTLSNKWTKNRQDGFQYIPQFLVKDLQEFIQSGQALKMYEQNYKSDTTLDIPDNPLLHVPTHPSHQLDRYMKKAGIQKHSREGKLDFHSFRYSYISNIVQLGASVKSAQTLARHSDPKLTMNIYAQDSEVQLRQLTEQVGKLIVK